MTALTTEVSKKGRKALVVNQEVINTRFTQFTSAINALQQNESVLKIVLASNIPDSSTKDIRSQFAEVMKGSNAEAWKQFQFLFVRLQNRITRQSDDAVCGMMQYDVMEKLLPIILELYGSEVKEDDESEVTE